MTQSPSTQSSDTTNPNVKKLRDHCFVLPGLLIPQRWIKNEQTNETCPPVFGSKLVTTSLFLFRLFLRAPMCYNLCFTFSIEVRELKNNMFSFQTCQIWQLWSVIFSFRLRCCTYPCSISSACAGLHHQVIRNMHRRVKVHQSSAHCLYSESLRIGAVPPVVTGAV